MIVSIVEFMGPPQVLLEVIGGTYLERKVSERSYQKFGWRPRTYGHISGAACRRSIQGWMANCRTLFATASCKRSCSDINIQIQAGKVAIYTMKKFTILLLLLFAPAFGGCQPWPTLAEQAIIKVDCGQATIPIPDRSAQCLGMNRLWNAIW